VVGNLKVKQLVDDDVISEFGPFQEEAAKRDPSAGRAGRPFRRHRAQVEFLGLNSGPDSPRADAVLENILIKWPFTASPRRRARASCLSKATNLSIVSETRSSPKDTAETLLFPLDAIPPGTNASDFPLRVGDGFRKIERPRVIVYIDEIEEIREGRSRTSEQGVLGQPKTPYLDFIDLPQRSPREPSPAYCQFRQFRDRGCCSELLT
jgi:hypothetical protein